MLVRRTAAAAGQLFPLPGHMTARSVVAADASGVIVSWDEGAHDMHGFTAGQVIGARKVGDLFGPPLDSADSMRDLLDRMSALAPAPAVWAGDVECRHASGIRFTAEIVATPGGPSGRGPAGVVLVCRRAASTFGAEFLPKLSHELRSKLAAIIGLTRILLMRLYSGQADTAAVQARQLEMIHASAARLLSTIQQVVDLARIESGLVHPSPQLVDCGAVIAEMAAELETATAKSGRRLRIDIPQNSPVVTCDPGILGQLLRELAGNALRFAGPGEVRIRVRDGGGAVVIEVSDDGPGIPPHEQDRIFEPFERGELADERDDGAAGLGLHLARQQAGLLGAQLSLCSRPGSGSTFTVTFAEPSAQSGTGPGTESGS